MEFELVPNTSIRNGLEQILHNYVQMNDKDEEKNIFIKQLMDGLRADISNVCKTNLPGLDIWTNSSHKKGYLNWPDVPWIAFGGPEWFADDKLSFSLNINFQWPAHRSGVFLTILPFAKGWHERFPYDADRVFYSYRRKFTSLLTDLNHHKFFFGVDVDPGTNARLAVNMARMYIVHKYYPINRLPTEEDFQRDILLAIDAQQRLIRPDGPILWNMSIPSLEDYSEEEMLESLLKNDAMSYGVPQLMGNDLTKLWGHSHDPAVRTDLTMELRDMGIDERRGDGIWTFIHKIREGDLINIRNNQGDIVMNGHFVSKCHYVNDGLLPLVRSVEWTNERGPSQIIDRSKGIDVPKLI
ncbi:MAG: DUF3578 domain-containing protein [Methanomassiliicoccales archaeon]|nr:DUF3578 domain-containing protein [Methanomassiliicoccales archaeon]